MLKDLFPRDHRRYSSLPLLGPIADGFETWLVERGYQRAGRRWQLRAVVRVDRYLRRHGVRRLADITRSELCACSAALGRRRPNLPGTVHALERYLDTRGLLLAQVPDPPSRTATQLSAYAAHLVDVRGLEPSTIHQHVFTAREFLDHMRYETVPSQLAALTASDIEEFVRAVGSRLSRASLQHTIAQLRGFLRFLAAINVVNPGLDTQIDTPRVYRFEQLPRALPWQTVRRFLRSIDRTTPLGLRDYTMFFLIATYGLRASEIVALTLDDVDWRAGCIRVPQRKTGTPLVLPLIDAAGMVVLRYLRRGRAGAPWRELFLRMRAPAGVLKPTAVTEAFQAWSKRSGLGIPFQGAHCLRHSYAVHLLRRGTSLKAIGDLLGHRSAESTCMYLRLAIEDLRDVPLPLPREDSRRHGQEVRP